MVFVFLWLTYFVSHYTLWLHSCHCKRQDFILFFVIFIFLFLIKKKFIYFRVKERQSVSGGRGREKTQNLKQGPVSELPAQSLMWGLNWILTNWATQEPTIFIYFEREGEQVEQGQREREKDRGSEVGSVLTAVSLMWGLNSGSVRSWPEPKLDA